MLPSGPPIRNSRRNGRRSGWRIAWRAGAVAAATLATWIALWAGLVAPAPRPRARARWQTRVFAGWSRTLLRILNVQVRREGEPPVPPFFLVANHLSYLDIAVLGSQVPCTFVAKAEIADWPVVGLLCRSVGTIFIDRSRRRDVPRTLETIARRLGEGRGIVVFPEGTSGDGDAVLPFRSALLDLPARSSLPVYSAALFYGTGSGDPPARDAVCWWGDMQFLPHLKLLLGLSEVQARLVFHAEPEAAGDRKLLAETLWTRIAAAHATLKEHSRRL